MAPRKASRSIRALMLCTLHKLRSFYVRALPVDAFPRLLAHTLALDPSTKSPTQSLRCRPMVVPLRIGLRAHAGTTAKLRPRPSCTACCGVRPSIGCVCGNLAAFSRTWVLRTSPGERRAGPHSASWVQILARLKPTVATHALGGVVVSLLI